MKFSKISYAISLFSLLFLIQCKSIDTNNKSQRNSSQLQIESTKGATPWSSLDLNNKPDKFHFAIVTDRTGGHRKGVFEDAVGKLNLLQPEFVMSVGDYIEGYTTDLNQLDKEWNEFEGFVNRLDMPFFYIPGNHDITNQVMEDLWKERFGPSYYHFIYKDVLFLALNSEDQKRGAGKGTVSDKQFDYIKKTLEENKEVSWTLLFMHQPLWNQKDTKRWNEVEQLLKERKHTVYTGHEHRYVKYERNNTNYYVLATTGGASPLRGANMGEFDQVSWITMTKDGPIMANLHLKGIYDDAVFTSAMRKYVEKLGEKNPFQITPYYYEGEEFTEGTIEIKIKNEEDFSMHITLQEKSSIDIIGILDKMSLTIPPHTEETLSIKLQKRHFGFEEPMQLLASMSFRPDDIQTTIEYPFIFNLKPLPKYFLTETTKSKLIDGDSTDWDGFPYEYTANEGEMKTQFSITYDEQFVYFGAKVSDTDVISYGEGASWIQDNVGFVISALPMDQSAMSVGRHWYTDDFVQSMSPQKKGVKSVIYRDFIEGSDMVCMATEYGYFAEAKVPISYIEILQGEDWKTIRLQVIVDDKDGAKTERNHWQPDWRDKQMNVVGSGMFFKK